MEVGSHRELKPGANASWPLGNSRRPGCGLVCALLEADASIVVHVRG
jgi:hypothetical protein